ncbi:MAG: histidine kinase [Naasia sp.]
MNDAVVLATRVKSWEERFLDALTRENWVRWRFVVEVGVGAAYLLVIALSWISTGGLATVGTAVLLATAIVLHRIQPIAALLISAFVMLLLVLLGFSDGGSSIGLAGFPLVIVIFGAAAYGRQLTRIAALALVVLAALYVGGNYWWFGSTAGAFAFFLLTAALLGIPWLAGALVRLGMSRRSLGQSVVATEVKLNAAEHDVSIEQERNRVARDVHDIVAHSLAVVIAQADGARYAARTSPPAVEEALTTIAATAREALTDVRALLTELRHSQDRGPQPGMNDLDSLVRGFRESGLEIDWSSYGTGVAVSESTGLAVYRVVQEALTNALRHGGRRRPVDMEFDWSDSSLAVTVTNDVTEGERTVNHAGHGIPGMHERATLAGGAFSAADGTNGRFRVRATFPLDRTSARTQPISTVPRP